MIDSIWGIFTIGLLLGAPSGIAPGPMLILIISETLRHGIRAGAKVACIPLLTDIPVVLISGFYIRPNFKYEYPAGCNFSVWISFSTIFGHKKYSNHQCRNYGFYTPPATPERINDCKFS